jgi:hypothetical protein
MLLSLQNSLIDWIDRWTTTYRSRITPGHCEVEGRSSARAREDVRDGLAERTRLSEHGRQSCGDLSKGLKTLRRVYTGSKVALHAMA